MPENRISNRAVFLDRDGTVIVEKDYLANPALIQFVDGAISALRTLREAGFRLVIVTNQSGIARGLYSMEDYRAVEARMEEMLREEGVELDGVFFCPHHPDFSGSCECRKPALGMYREAARKLDIDLENSVYIGDRIKDIRPASVLGGRGILVRTGYGESEAAQLPMGMELAANLLEAAQRIVGKTRTTP